MDHIKDKSLVKSVLVWERHFAGEESETPYPMKDRDVRFDILVANQRPYCAPVQMDAEDNLFILYTSGSTGMPKGLVHTTGGYALYVSFGMVVWVLCVCVARSMIFPRAPEHSHYFSTQAAHTTKTTFDLAPGDIFACVA